MSQLTWIVPSGSFDYETTVINGVEREVPVANSYHTIEKNSDNRVSFLDFLTSFHNGMVDNADLIMLIFIVSGAFFIIVKTGAFHALVVEIIIK